MYPYQIMAYTIWDIARLRAGQNNTTVEFELSRMAKKGARRRAARKTAKPSSRSDRFTSAWAADATQARLPYAD